LRHKGEAQARNQGGAFGAISHPENFKTLHSKMSKHYMTFAKLSKNKDEILYFNHFLEVLLKLFFVLLVNYLLTSLI